MNKLIFILGVLIITVLSCTEDTLDFVGTGTIKGKIVTALDFEPIEGVKIVLTPSNNTVFSNADGDFIFPEIPAGEYAVKAIKRGYITGFTPAVASNNFESNVVIELNLENTDNKAPLAPKLLGPEDGTLDTELTVSMNWEGEDPEDDKLRYKLRIKNDRDNSEIIHDQLLDTVFIISDLRNNTKYFWQVSANDSINAEVWSLTKSFTTKPNTTSRFLFVRDNQIFEMNEDSIERALTPVSMKAWRPRKNNSSNRIAFLKTDSANEIHIYTMNSDGSDIFKVTDAVPLRGFKESELDFSWDKYGDKFIYGSYDKLYEIHANGSGLTEIYQTEGGRFITECDWSSDSNTIALKVNDERGYDVHIFTIDYATGDTKGIILGSPIAGTENAIKGAAGGLNLSIDASRLLYTYDISEHEDDDYRQLETRIFLYEIPEDNLLTLDRGIIPGTIDYDPRFSPDESFVIYTNSNNDGLSEESIYRRNASPGAAGVQELFSNATMPDWE